MDKVIREITLVSIHNALNEGVIPAPMYDDPEDVKALYEDEIRAFKENYGHRHGLTYSEVIQFEDTYRLSVIELDYRQTRDREEFKSLPPWERAPETWAN